MIKASGKKVVALRKKQYLGRDELAERAKMTRSNLQRIEQARTAQISLKTLRKLSEGLKIPPEALEEMIRPGPAKSIIELSPEVAAALARIASRENPPKTVEQLLYAFVVNDPLEQMTISRRLQSSPPSGAAGAHDAGKPAKPSQSAPPAHAGSRGRRG